MVSLVLAVAFGTSVQGKDFTMKAKQREAAYLPIVIEEFEKEGLPPELGAAIARQESNWDPDATVLHGGDGKRGGAYGLCQMTLKTALALDKTATPARLLNPRYNCHLAALLCKENWKRANGRLQDVISLYNSGKQFHAAPDVTKLVYVPRVTAFLAEYREMIQALRAPASNS